MDISPSMAMTRPGKSAMAVGQMAKVAVAEARSAGADLPKNAQGIAASGIAKGAEPASIFAALVTPPPPEDPEVTPADPSLPEVPLASSGDDVALITDDAASAALDLLLQEDEPPV